MGTDKAHLRHAKRRHQVVDEGIDFQFLPVDQVR